ncbi:MAG: orotate phosphoribosyltransferase [Candidatus Magasanikbacteria bacterium RIFCSPHIGHO2_02_FULL_51_14]|uniref:Orotate phosphoribosyltransferase n=1 Tax=Candidatus Magasanikbacteria bacterium RIFCSPHIGHO2_02_FULL_51_14 TaxID=1798683 RepID=A0A1F6MQ69_9BACT|nr:MAG: orotate phosphoribosyltransferase [Candidatus Magasanikbacteria bacterium RIFCSPHIGHO2_02_FULL_51_14]
MPTEDLILALNEIGSVKFGEFKLVTGLMSPIYLDLRATISYPEVLRTVAEIMWEKVKDLRFDLLCGVPYTALPIATAMSLAHGIPMVMRRKDVKDHGTKKIIEGVFAPGQTCLIVEDLVTSGQSVFETADALEREGLKVSDAVVLLDREQGGRENLRKRNYSLHAVFTMTELLAILLKHNKIGQATHDRVLQFIQEHKVKR